MTFDLSSIKPTRQDRPARILVYGPHKIGKSTFASCAESPIFIPTEDGQDNIDAEAFPLCKTWQDVLDAVAVLYKDEHNYKTVVLDSGDWAESLVQQQVARDKKVSGIEDIGYGKGYVFAAEMFHELLDGLNALRNQRGMQVIVLCHAEIKKFDDPMADSYDRYQIKLHKISGKLIQEWADVIGFAQVASVTKTEEQGFDKKRTRAVDLNKRVLHLSGGVAFDAGNRYDLPPTIDLVWDQFEQALNEAKKAGQNNG